MDSNLPYFLQIASTFSVVLPILAASLVFHKVDYKIKWFVALLVFGFIIDLSGWYFYLTKQASVNHYTRYTYELVEALYWFWLTTKISTSSILKKVSLYALYCLIPFWLVCIKYNEL